MKLGAAWLCLCVVLKGAADVPELSASNVLNAASRFAGRISPGEIVVLFPFHAGPPALAGAQVGADGIVLTVLGETRVLFR